jgi:predicted ArsR family transcriptional regulator
MQSTRQRILEILKEKTQATVEELSDELELTPVTVRHHLDVLRGEGLVGAPKVIHRSGPGRPQHAYELTEAAGDHFPKNYHNLAGMMLDEIRERVSPDEMDEIVSKIAARMAAQAPKAGEQKPEEILDAAVRFLNEQGYVARWENGPDGQYLMHTCNCPYERVAQTHGEICNMDLRLVRRLVGVQPKRLSRMAEGDNSCSYVVAFDERDARTG